MPTDPLSRRALLQGAAAAGLLAAAGCGVAPGRGATEGPPPGAYTARAGEIDEAVRRALADYAAGASAPGLQAAVPALPGADPAAVFATLRALGVVELAVESAAATRPASASPAGGEASTPGPAATGAAQAAPRATVRLRYRLDVDDAPTTTVTTWEEAAGRVHRVGPALFPWEVPGVGASVGPATRVVGPSAGVAAVREVAEEAAGRAARGWPARLPTPVVWLPPTGEDFTKWTGGTRAGTNAPAVTLGPTRDDRSLGADRVVLDPVLWERLNRAGRALVLTHEFGHLALRADGPGPRPRVLEEGWCEHLAYAGVSLPDAQTLAPLLRGLRAHGLPEALPAAADLDGERRAETYGAARVLARTVADVAGEAGLLAWVRDARGRELTDPAVARALTAATGLDLAGLTARWRARLAALVA